MFRFILKKYIEKAYHEGFGEGFRIGVRAGKSLAENKAVIFGPRTKMIRDIEEILRKKGVD